MFARRARSSTVSEWSSRYGWPGFYGTAWYNDPAEDMTTIFIMQRAHAGDQRLPMWNDFWTPSIRRSTTDRGGRRPPSQAAVSARAARRPDQ
jgi:CubicO group peptidase (beta-lactamase class C family)